MVFFVRGNRGAEYHRRAIEGPWIELGAAVNAGIAYVGNIGTAVVDFTALGGNHASVNSQCTQSF
jgi:adenylate cyclase